MIQSVSWELFSTTAAVNHKKVPPEQMGVKLAVAKERGCIVLLVSAKKFVSRRSNLQPVDNKFASLTRRL